MNRRPEFTACFATMLPGSLERAVLRARAGTFVDAAIRVLAEFDMAAGRWLSDARITRFAQMAIVQWYATQRSPQPPVRHARGNGTTLMHLSLLLLAATPATPFSDPAILRCAPLFC
jgi:hypothetical protein